VASDFRHRPASCVRPAPRRRFRSSLRRAAARQAAGALQNRPFQNHPGLAQGRHCPILGQGCLQMGHESIFPPAKGLIKNEFLDGRQLFFRAPSSNTLCFDSKTLIFWPEQRCFVAKTKRFVTDAKSFVPE